VTGGPATAAQLNGTRHVALDGSGNLYIGDMRNQRVRKVTAEIPAGFVTGGGWIDSPAGTYTADPGLSGKATFGFVSKFKKGATVLGGGSIAIHKK
jgi:hypothetical protein